MIDHTITTLDLIAIIASGAMRTLTLVINVAMHVGHYISWIIHWYMIMKIYASAISGRNTVIMHQLIND